MNLEAGNGYVATEAQYRAALVCGTIPPPAPIGIVTPTKKDKKEDLKMIAYRNFHSGFYWRLGEMGAEGLSEADRKAQLALIVMMSNSP
jgi:hypothetical protein